MSVTGPDLLRVVIATRWHTVMDAVVVIGEQLVDHPDRDRHRIRARLGRDLFARIGRSCPQHWSTQTVDVRRGQSPRRRRGRTAAEPCRWLAERDDEWRERIEWATWDLSASYRTVFDTMLPDAVQVADPLRRRAPRQPSPR